MSNQNKSKPNFIVIAAMLSGGLLLGILCGTAIAFVRMSGNAETVAKNSNVSSPQTVKPTAPPTKENPVDAVIKEINTFKINFLPMQTTVASESQLNLEKIAEKLKTLPNGMKIEIGVHTENVGDRESNVYLSMQRAIAVKNNLVALGVKSEMLSFGGYGGSQPIAPNDTQENRAKNRRVEFKKLEKAEDVFDFSNSNSTPSNK